MTSLKLLIIYKHVQQQREDGVGQRYNREVGLEITRKLCPAVFGSRGGKPTLLQWENGESGELPNSGSEMRSGRQ